MGCSASQPAPVSAAHVGEKFLDFRLPSNFPFACNQHTQYPCIFVQLQLFLLPPKGIRDPSQSSSEPVKAESTSGHAAPMEGSAHLLEVTHRMPSAIAGGESTIKVNSIILHNFNER